MLQGMGGTRLQGAEEMLHVRWPTRNDTVVVTIAQIAGMVHLIALEPGTGWLVNRKMDLVTLNTIYD